MNELVSLLKKGNKSALMAGIVNAIISLIRGAAFFVTGDVAMFAETMHAIGDTANQFFVFIGSGLSKKEPTKRFPKGFGRLVNLVLLGAVLVVGIMAYETIKEGFHHVFHPTEPVGFWIVVSVLSLGILLEGSVMVKAMKEIAHETNSGAKGFRIITRSFSNFKHAKPATKLVFLEDSIATSGGVLALTGVFLSHYTPFHAAEGIVSIIIGLLMFVAVGKVFLDNAAGAIGEVHEEMQGLIGNLVMDDNDVQDIQRINVIKEGEDLHVELEIEIDPKMTIEQADNIKERLEQKIKNEGVADVVIEFDKDNGIREWYSDK